MKDARHATAARERMTEEPRRTRMIRTGGRRHAGGRRWVAPAVALLFILAVICGAIIVSSVTQRHVQFDDGTVWVTSLKNRKAARFNVRIRQADAAVGASSRTFDVAQHGSATLLEEGDMTSTIKASTVTIEGRTATGDNTIAMIGGGTAAFLDTTTGNVWAGKADDIASIVPADARPQMRLGTGGKAVVDDDGTVWGYRPSEGMVFTLAAPGTGRAARIGSLSGGTPMTASSFTVVDGKPVIISGRRLVFAGGATTLDVSGRLLLQAPSVDGRQSGWVAVASPGRLTTVKLNASKPKPLTLVSGGRGEPAQPVSSSGCVHAAFSQQSNNYARVCSATDVSAPYRSLKEISTTSQLVFRANHRQVVLNDVIDGTVWHPRHSPDAIAIQWNALRTEHSEQERSDDVSADNGKDFAATCSDRSGRIMARDDDFGVRVAERQILDVLRNDEQTDCSVLRITRTNAPTGGNVSVWPIYDGRYLQLDASHARGGSVSFTYETSDGRGQSSRATVHLHLTDGENRAPEQNDIPPELSVEQGAIYTTNALGSFTDPDGDPITLVSAVASNSDQVALTTRADGRLTFDAGGATGGRIGVEVTVSDGQSTGTGMLYVSIKPANTLAADIDPVSKSTLPDTATTIELEPYVHATGAQPVRLSSVESPQGASATMHASDMTVLFTATQAGTYYVPYTVMQGTMPATGLVRVEVQPAATEAAKPIASNDVAVLGSDNTAIVEPLSNDIDPMGGVLSITSVSAEASSGVAAGLVGHRRIYLTARRTPNKPIKVSYSVANAVGNATGTITAHPPALSNVGSPPKAGDIEARVRTGGIVSVDVLDHVSHGESTTVTLQNDLRTDKATFKGLAFVSGSTVRYQAPNVTGTYPVIYTVRDDLGNVASGTITIRVHGRDAAGKAAPVPHDVEAQVAAGRKVRIEITLTGIDEDGDDSQLLGLGNVAPQLGRIIETGADYLVYEAYEDSSGTDTFSYAVEDWTGQRAQAQVRVGVFQGTSDSGVVARDDRMALRPGTAVTVPVTHNDISGDDTELSVEGTLESRTIDDARVQDDMIAFTAPSQPGTAYISYTVRNKAGLKDTGTLTVDVDGNARIEAPGAYDYRVPSSATIDRRSVDVDVSRWIANPSGTAGELRVDVDPSAQSHARLKGDERSRIITVELTDEARAVPYTVTNTTHGITSTAFIHVPAYGVFPPTLRPKAPELRVNAGETIDINIADHVRVGAGKTPYVNDSGSVSATKAANNDLYADDTRLRFTAARNYAGPASITFTASDGKPGKSKGTIVNTATITLPISVIGSNAGPPTFSSPTIEVAAGEEATTVDLRAMTHTLGDGYADAAEYAYSADGTSGTVTADVSSSGRMRIRAEKNASPGTVVHVPIRITYAKGTVNAGVSVRVVASSRPLAHIEDKEVRLQAGSSRTVHLFDGAYNPFADTPLRAVQCVSDGDAKLSTRCDSSGSITVIASKGIGASRNKVIVAVEDGTGDKERRVTGTIVVSVVDRPQAPLLSPLAAKPRDGAVDLAWTPNDANGSPILEYEVAYGPSAAQKVSCALATVCTVDGLHNGRTYTFTVRARNEVGWSEHSNAVVGRPDKVPDAPTDVRVEGGRNTLTVSWQTPRGAFSAPTGYTVTIVGPNGWTDRRTAITGTRCIIAIGDDVLTAGTSFTAHVTAVNPAGEGEAGTASGSDVYGKPDSPTLTLRQDGDTVNAVVHTRAMRGNSCRTLRVDRDTASDFDCDDARFSVPLRSSDFFTNLTVTVTMSTDQGMTVSASQSLNITTRIGTISTSTDCSGTTCTLRWRKLSGHVNGAIIDFGSHQGELHRESGTLVTRISPWTAGPAATVTPVFNGRKGTPIHDNGVTDYIHREAPSIDTDILQFTWDAIDRNVIRVSGLHGIVNHGRDDITTFHLRIGGKSKPFNTQTTVIDVSDIASERITWSLTVTMGNDPNWSAMQSGIEVMGLRAADARRTALLPSPDRKSLGDDAATPFATHARAASIRRTAGQEDRPNQPERNDHA